ncbi:MAG: hypothetical protein HZA50_16065 [Planctomycetes bacterium]|nr:hypothetical protein [Planctomycetota bacterium]
MIAKAGYYAYHLLGKLQGNRVSIQLSDPFVQAAAARDGRTLRVILANFAPPQMMLQDLALKQLIAGGHSGKELKALAQKQGSDPRQLLSDRRRIETLDAPPDVRAAALALYDAVQLSARRQRQAVELRITLKDAAAGRYRLREYRVDSRNANAYGQREAIDQSLQKAVKKGVSSARDYLAQRWSETEMAQLPGKKDAADNMAYFLALPPSSPAAWAPPRPGNLTSYFVSLPPARQRDALAAMELLKEVKRDCIKEINASLKPREQNVSEATSDGSITWRGALPPYGVMLLEIEQRD